MSIGKSREGTFSCRSGPELLREIPCFGEPSRLWLFPIIKSFGVNEGQNLTRFHITYTVNQKSPSKISQTQKSPIGSGQLNTQFNLSMQLNISSSPPPCNFNNTSTRLNAGVPDFRTKHHFFSLYNCAKVGLAWVLSM